MTRKINHPELIFNHVDQGRPLSLHDIFGAWQVHTNHKDCYVCQKFQYVRLYYRRNEKGLFSRMNDSVKEKKLRDLMPQTDEPYSHLPILFGSFLN